MFIVSPSSIMGAPRRKRHQPCSPRTLPQCLHLNPAQQTKRESAEPPADKYYAGPAAQTRSPASARLTRSALALRRLLERFTAGLSGRRASCPRLPRSATRSDPAGRDEPERRIASSSRLGALRWPRLPAETLSHSPSSFSRPSRHHRK